MKLLELKNTSFLYLEQGFKEWLSTLGYSETTVGSWPVHVREFFHYLEQHQVKNLTQVTPQRTYHFIQYIKHRRSPVTGTALSTNSINKIINSVNAFARYVNSTEKHVLDISPRRISLDALTPNVLSLAEIQQLYEASFAPRRENSLAMGQRDRAILAIFYGCGLRKDEGGRLNIFDIDTYKGLVFVRKAKGNKQRYVPIAARHLQDIRDYLEEGRNWFLMNNKTSWHSRKRIKKQNTDEEAFFLNQEGKRMRNFDFVFKRLEEESGILTHFSTHTLRHSIGTHLLQSGMKIEDIAKFLGHSSLESTQIYTHVSAGALAQENTTEKHHHDEATGLY